MKKILFITTRNPFSGRYSGDVIRAKKFVKHLSKKYQMSVVSLSQKNQEISGKNFIFHGYKSDNIILRIVYIFTNLINLRPLQLGYFYSKKISEFIKINHEEYDVLLFQSFRTAQYLPEICKKKCILDMGDLMSKNYDQASRRLSFFNPYRFIYFFESYLLKKYEETCFNKFDKILLLSKKEIKSINSKFQNKLIHFFFGEDNLKNKFRFNLKNNKIIFIGNIKYVPNRNACYDFVKKIFPLILKVYPNTEFHIIGEISKIDKFVLNKYKNVKILGKVNNLSPYLNRVICALANLKISTGVQTKLLTYMSFGIPFICSKQVAENFDHMKITKDLYYTNNKEIIKMIIKFKKNKNFSSSFSKKSINQIKKFKWNKVLSFLNKLI